MAQQRERTSSLTRRSLADQVADALVELILDEGLQDGDPLPSTAELSERFEVSRTVIREALAALAGRGIVTRSQGRECVVATPGSDDLSSLLKFPILRESVTPQDILDCRMALEVTAARGAATNRTDEDLAAIQAQFELLAGARNDQSFHQADIGLHRAMAAASGNPLLLLILDSLVDFLRDVRIQATKNRRGRGESLDDVIEQHAAIVTAISRGKADVAEAAMDRHLTTTAAEFKTTPRR